MKRRYAGFVIIPYRYFHLYNISSLLCEWQFVLISDFMRDSSYIEISNSPELLSLYLKRFIEKIQDDQSFDKSRYTGDHLFLHCLPSDFKFRIWPLVPNNNEQDIVIGQDTYMDGSWMSTETIQNMFINCPKYYMSIKNEDTTDGPYALSPRAKDDITPRNILERIVELVKGRK
jgi:hypothetical protein